MPALLSVDNNRILITGSSGYIGAWITKILLERGYRVLAAVRSQNNVDSLKRVFAAHSDKLSTVVIPDMTKEGAFDEAVKGVQGVIHTASPVINGTDLSGGYAGPAVAATTTILRSVHLYGKDVQRVVYTSSCGALDRPGSGRRVLDDTDWNDAAVAEVEKLGKDAPEFIQYIASKTLAERAAFNFVKENKPAYDIVTVLPSFTFGPFVHEVSSKEKLGSSLAVLANLLPPNPTPAPAALATPYGGYVHVEDVAELHILGLTEEKASGARLIASNEPWSVQQIYDSLNALNPPLSVAIPKGNPGVMDEALEIYGHAKVTEIFPDFKFQGFDAAFGQPARQFDERGWLV